ncbi:hypothetical protein [Paraburkholderia aromaticivorans]|uniref:hypothetical protein n=1 Tax=Paraburkholderia aromaticivorans TaxID=2026199 RepID=UPI001456213E|nr:hypothetical protein [Paraburkholderia aromaticivorans]
MTVLAFHNAVLDSDLPMGVKMALITIDRHRNKEGEEVWPGIERLCHLSSSKKTAFMGYLRVAEDLGWLTRERRFNRSNVFDLCIPAMPKRLADAETPMVRNLNHQTADSSESELPMVRNLNFEVTKEVTTNLEVTNIIFASAEKREIEQPEHAAEVVASAELEVAAVAAEPVAAAEPVILPDAVCFLTDDMRSRHSHSGLPADSLTRFNVWYAERTHLYPDPEKAFVKHLNTERSRLMKHGLAH